MRWTSSCAPDRDIERSLDAEEEVENVTSSGFELIAENLEETSDLITIWLWPARDGGVRRTMRDSVWT